MNPDDPICYLPRSSYLTFFFFFFDGVIGLKTHMASIEWLDGIKRNTWVKVYGANSPRGLINEVIGYLMLKSLDLPQPELAGILELEVSEDTDPEMWQKLSEIDRYRGFTYAWVSTDNAGINQRVEIKKENDPKLQQYLEHLFFETLKDWKQLDKLIACDHWIFNEDRNMGNILELPNKTFSLIDHGEILTSSNWNSWDLIQTRPINLFWFNIYIKTLCKRFSSTPLLIPEHAMDCLKASKASQAKAFTEIKDKLQEYLEDLLDNEFLDSKIEGVPKKPVSEMLLEFLESRASNTLEFESHCEIVLGPQNSTFS